MGRSVSVSGRGLHRSENVGLSSENMGENPMPRNPKGSSGRLVRGGLVWTYGEAERRSRWITGQHSCTGYVLGRGTEKASQARCWLLVQVFKALRSGENVLS